MENNFIHKPVMLEEVLGFLNLRDGMTIIDATIGAGGHAIEIVKRISPRGKLIGIDQDSESLKIAKERLKDYANQCIFAQDNFSNIDKVLNSLEIKNVDAVILDLGISSFQLNNPARGFSFAKEGPLDMRMDKENPISAYELVNNLKPEELSLILWRFGQERFSNRIAKAIVNYRNNSPIRTTTELADLVCRVIAYRMGYQRIHPATRTFQALRIYVNRELESLEFFLNKIPLFMGGNARMCVISFHSLEDRIVKNSFRNLAKANKFKLIIKKPAVPQQEEINDNPRSRSAKLRVAERI